MKILGFLIFVVLFSAFQIAAQNCVPAPGGLVAWYRAENNTNDSALSNHGTAQGGVTYAAGQVGQNFSFDGTDDQVFIPASSSLNVGASNNGMTIEGWINPANASNVNPIAEWNNGSTFGAHFYVSGSQGGIGGPGSLYVNLSGTSGSTTAIFASAQNLVTSNQWQHVALTYDRMTGNAVIYRNGVAVATANFGSFAPKTDFDLYLGARVAGSGAPLHFGGLINEMSFYNRALSASEMQGIFNAGAIGKCLTSICTAPPPGMIGWYAADGNERDYSSTMNNAYGVTVNVGFGPARYAPGKVQRAFLLEGDNFVQTEPTNTQDPPTAATIDAWVLFNQKPSVAGRIMEIFSRGDFNRDLDLAALTDDKVYLYIANGQNVGTTFTVETGVWYHFAGTWDATGLRIYVNGVLNNTNPVQNVTRNPSPGVNTRIGEGALFTNRRFVGLIDEVELFNRALSVSEIQAIYNAGSFGKCKTANNLTRYLDFDGDGRSDISLFRPHPDENNNYWYVLRSSTSAVATFEWGIQTDKIAPADYDGDGRTDFAVWRENELPNNRALFYIYNSSNNTIRIEEFGLNGDRLTVGDWDGDGKADLSVYRDGAQSFFFYRGSLNNPSGNITYIPWGTTGDKPVDGDYDGDGKLDAAVFRPSSGTWYIRNSSNGVIQYARFGLATDQPVPADYDGDGITDVAVYRPSEGSWYIQRSQLGFWVSRFGNSTDIPVPADYDGDGKTDVAVFRNDTWYLQQSSVGVTVTQFGTTNDKPVPAAYLP